MTDTAFPTPSGDRLDGWDELERTTETVFELGPVRVTTATVVYEDVGLRAAIRERTGVDSTWRFFFASRVAVPAGDPAGALRRLVVGQVRRAFVDRLRARGFDAVEERERRDFRVGDAEADLVGYDALGRGAGLAVDVVGWVAVWGASDGYLLAGGAYPTSVRTTPDATDESDVADLVEPDRFRADLFDLIRSVT